jgi:hypothetical protein
MGAFIPVFCGECASRKYQILPLLPEIAQNHSNAALCALG